MPTPPDFDFDSHILEFFAAEKSRGETAHSPIPFGGCYNQVLVWFFPASEEYLIYPPHRHEDGTGLSHSTIFTVRYDWHAVLFLDVKPSSHFDDPTLRAAAHKQILERMHVLAKMDKNTVPTGKLPNQDSPPTIYGVSALGTKLRFYEFDTKTGTVSSSMPLEANHGDDSKSMWHVDIMEIEGLKRMKAFADDVKEMCNSFYGHRV